MITGPPRSICRGATSPSNCRNQRSTGPRNRSSRVRRWLVTQCGSPPFSQLRTAVRRGAGCSPKDYLLRIRLDRAKELLATTDLPVAAVARRVGYDDPAYFSRLFTRRVGVAPVHFRIQESRPLIEQPHAP